MANIANYMLIRLFGCHFHVTLNGRFSSALLKNCSSSIQKYRNTYTILIFTIKVATFTVALSLLVYSDEPKENYYLNLHLKPLLYGVLYWVSALFCMFSLQLCCLDSLSQLSWCCFWPQLFSEKKERKKPTVHYLLSTKQQLDKS